MASKRLTLHVVSHTRWDRENHRTFQWNRIKLVRLFDQLLLTFENTPEFGSFFLDGQTILLDDYLDIRPDQKDIVANYVETGHLILGPWYVIPDPVLSSPEALIRNLLKGTQTVAHYDRTTNIAYLPTISQTPAQALQILTGFDISSLYTVTAPQEAPAMFWSQTPDETYLLTIHMRTGFNNAAKLPAEPLALKNALYAARDKLKRSVTGNDFLMLNGDLFAGPQPEAAAALQAANKRMRGTHAIHSSLSEYANAVAQADLDLPVYSANDGLVDSQCSRQGKLSARIQNKIANHQIETALLFGIEPFGAWAYFLDRQGAEGAKHSSQAELTQEAWRLLLQNHSQTTISGQCADTVQEEIATRFNQSKQISNELLSESIDTLAHYIDTSPSDKMEAAQPVIVFNLSNTAQTDIAGVQLSVPKDVENLEVTDENGAKYPADLLPDEADENAVTLRFLAPDIPAFGYRTFYVSDASEREENTTIDDGYAIDNAWLSASIDRQSGQVTLFDKSTGRSFTGLNHYIDGGDAGDLLQYRPPLRDTIINIATNTPLFVQRYISPVEQGLRFLQIYRLPQSLSPDGQSRLPLAAQFVPISITTTIRLARDIPRMDVHVTVLNSARDHRLQVRFPTGIQTDQALIDSHMDIARHSLVKLDGHFPYEEANQLQLETHQRDFITVVGSDTGLTVANRGLPEVSAFNTEEGAEIRLTLLRAVSHLQNEPMPDCDHDSDEWLIATPDAQCQGEYEFEYSLIPHGPDPTPAWDAARAFQRSCQTHLTSIHAGTLPKMGQLVWCDNPDFTLSTVKLAENDSGIIIRGYNLTGENQEVTLTLGLDADNVSLTRIDEIPLPELSPVTGNSITFTARPQQIVTCLFAINY